MNLADYHALKAIVAALEQRVALLEASAIER